MSTGKTKRKTTPGARKSVPKPEENDGSSRLSLYVATFVSLTCLCSVVYLLQDYQRILQESKILKNQLSSIEQEGKIVVSPFQHLTAEEVEDIGSVFYAAKVAEIVTTDDEVLRRFGMDRKALDEPQYIRNHTLANNMLSVHASFLESDFDRVSTRLKRHGVVIIQNVLSYEMVSSLQQYILEEVLQDKQCDHNTVSACTLSMDGIPGYIYKFVMGKIRKLLQSEYEQELHRKTMVPELVEFGLLLNGRQTAKDQLAPSLNCYAKEDDKHENIFARAKAYNVLIYPMSTSADMNLLELYPASHMYASLLMDGERSLLQSVPYTRISAPAGSLVIVNSCIFHRFSSTKKLNVPLLSFSFQGEKKQEVGGTISEPKKHVLKSEYVGKYPLIL
jgi:hypothetical protein